MNLKNPILEIAVMLLITIISLAAYAFYFPKDSVIAPYIKTAPIKEFLTDTTTNILQVKDKNLVKQKIPPSDTGKNTSIQVAPPEHLMDSTPQKILMVGESMIEGLMFPFKKYGKFNGHTIIPKIWYGSRLLDWGANDTLKKIIDLVKPTYVIVSIGSNELFIRNIEEREPYVKNILAQLGNTKFIWVGPPNPKKDNGINDLIARNIGADRFFVSKYMHFLRKRDGVHPKADQCYKWADSISDWIMTQSRYPIKLKRPIYDSSGNMILPKDQNDTLKKALPTKPSYKSKRKNLNKKPKVITKNPAIIEPQS